MLSLEHTPTKNKTGSKHHFDEALRSFISTPYGESIIIATSSRKKFEANRNRFGGKHVESNLVLGLNPENYGFKEPIDDVIQTAIQKALAVIKILTEVRQEHVFLFNFHTLQFPVDNSPDLEEKFKPQIEGQPYAVVAMDSATSLAGQLEDFNINTSAIHQNVLRAVRAALSTSQTNAEKKSSKRKVKDFHNLSRTVELKMKKLGRPLTPEEMDDLLSIDRKKTSKEYAKPFWVRFRAGKVFMTPDLRYGNTAGIEFFVRFKALPQGIIDEAYKDTEAILKIGPRVNLALLVEEHPELVEIILYRNHGDTDDALRVLPKKNHRSVPRFIIEGVPPYELSTELLRVNESQRGLTIVRRRLNI